MDGSVGAEDGRVSRERPTSDRARVLLEINNAVVAHLDLAQVLKAVSTCLKREINHDFAALALYNPERHELRLHTLDFPDDPAFLKQGQLIPLVGTPASLAFSSRKTVLRHRPDPQEFTADIMKLAEARGIKSGCAVPLICHDKIVGSMAIASLRESAFTEADAELLTQIGAQVAIAVDNAQNFERLKSAEREVVRERDRKELLLKINNAVVSQLDMGELLKSISASLRQIVPHDGAFFTLLDSATNRLRVQALDLRMLDQVPFEEGVSIALEGTPEGEAIATGEAVLAAPLVDLKRFHSPWVRNATDRGVRCGCAVPLIAHGRALGALSVVSQTEGAFDKESARLLADCSGQMAIALENALNFENARNAERESRQERDRSRLLLEINNAVISHLDLKELLKCISAHLHRIIHHDAAFMSLLDTSGTRLRVQAFDLQLAGIGPFDEEIQLALDATPEGEAIRELRPVLIRHRQELARFSDQAVRQAEQVGVHSGCAVPLVVQGHALGALTVVSFHDAAFSESDLQLLEQCSTQIAIAVQNSLNFEGARAAERQVSRERDRTKLLLEVNNAVVLHLDLTQLLKSISTRLAKVMSNDSAFIALCEEDGMHLQTQALDLGQLNNVVFSKGLRIPREGTPEEQAIVTGQPVLVGSVAEFQSFPSRFVHYAVEHGVKSGCFLPLIAHGKTLGALGVVSLRERAFSADDAQLLQEISSQIAIAVQNAMNYEKSRRAEFEAKLERDRSNLLLNINHALVSHLDLAELVKAVSASLQETIQHDCVALAIYDEAIGKMFSQAVSSSFEPMHQGIHFDPEGTITGLVVKTGKPVHTQLPNTEQFPSAITQGFSDRGFRTLYAAPLAVHGRTLGVISISSVREEAFSENDQLLFQQVANSVAIATANAVAVRELETLKDKLAQEKLYLEDEIRTELNFDEIIGQSAAIREVLKLVETVAASDSTVLLLGETGTGKELIARAVHEHSRRKGRTFVKLNCAAIPTGLLESELFGHEKGAFTGAIAQKIGRLELADQGTLFLDEVGDIPPEIQPKLLRALQEREFERLGSTHTKKVNVRLVAATNRDLEKMTETREFRSDLYYRLNVFPIRIPPLRERREDIPLLVRYFTAKSARQMQKRIETIPADTMNRLQQWHWPGNVRELENLIERAVILTSGSALQVPLPEIKQAAAPVLSLSTSAAPAPEGAEREVIIKTLRDTRGILAGPNGAAARLGLKRTTLQYKIKKLAITREEWWPTSN